MLETTRSKIRRIGEGAFAFAPVQVNAVHQRDQNWLRVTLGHSESRTAYYVNSGPVRPMTPGHSGGQLMYNWVSDGTHATCYPGSQIQVLYASGRFYMCVPFGWYQPIRASARREPATSPELFRSMLSRHVVGISAVGVSIIQKRSPLTRTNIAASQHPCRFCSNFSPVCPTFFRSLVPASLTLSSSPFLYLSERI